MPPRKQGSTEITNYEFEKVLDVVLEYHFRQCKRYFAEGMIEKDPSWGVPFERATAARQILRDLLDSTGNPDARAKYLDLINKKLDATYATIYFHKEPMTK